MKAELREKTPDKSQQSSGCFFRSIVLFPQLLFPQLIVILVGSESMLDNVALAAKPIT